MLYPTHHLSLNAGLTALVGADPFALDRPGSKALMIGIVAGKVAMLDQAATGVAAVEVDDFVLWHVSSLSNL